MSFLSGLLYLFLIAFCPSAPLLWRAIFSNTLRSQSTIKKIFSHNCSYMLIIITWLYCKFIIFNPILLNYLFFLVNQASCRQLSESDLRVLNTSCVEGKLGVIYGSHVSGLQVSAATADGVFNCVCVPPLTQSPCVGCYQRGLPRVRGCIGAFQAFFFFFGKWVSEQTENKMQIFQFQFSSFAFGKNMGIILFSSGGEGVIQCLFSSLFWSKSPSWFCLPAFRVVAYSSSNREQRTTRNPHPPAPRICPKTSDRSQSVSFSEGQTTNRIFLWIYSSNSEKSVNKEPSQLFLQRQHESAEVRLGACFKLSLCQHATLDGPFSHLAGTVTWQRHCCRKMEWRCEAFGGLTDASLKRVHGLNSHFKPNQKHSRDRFPPFHWDRAQSGTGWWVQTDPRGHPDPFPTAGRRLFIFSSAHQCVSCANCQLPASKCWNSDSHISIVFESCYFRDHPSFHSLLLIRGRVTVAAGYPGLPGNRTQLLWQIQRRPDEMFNPSSGFWVSPRVSSSSQAEEPGKPPETSGL